MSVTHTVTHPPIDFVDSDVQSLASHMRRCARARGRLFSLRNNLQAARAFASGRIVSSACVVAVVGLCVLAVL